MGGEKIAAVFLHGVSGNSFKSAERFLVLADSVLCIGIHIDLLHSVTDYDAKKCSSLYSLVI